jgi:hypothetical protein
MSILGHSILINVFAAKLGVSEVRIVGVSRDDVGLYMRACRPLHPEGLDHSVTKLVVDPYASFFISRLYYWLILCSYLVVQKNTPGER